MLEKITSLQNPRIKNLVRLRERSHRRRQQRFICEGLRECMRAQSARWPLETVYFCDDLFTDPEAIDWIDHCAATGLDCVQLPAPVFAKISQRQGPDGVLAILPIQQRQLNALTLSEQPLLVVLEAIEKPGNLGAILRTANAAGADAVLLLDSVCDAFNPNVIRASQGAVFDIPAVEVSADELTEFLAANGIVPCSLTPHAQNCLWDADLRGPRALMFGAEHHGLSQRWLDDPAHSFQLPMQGITDSLNVSATVAVCLFECARQRRAR